MPTKPETSKPEQQGRQDAPLLAMRDLHVHFQLRGGTFKRLLVMDTGTVNAVDGVDIRELSLASLRSMTSETWQ